ncbi:hypothetical protein KOW79_019063 [Hemibagrus wyckioides]|uniref:Uncharacterized protein n=1 Tax=Hemibagrus wyckioides TaxID=337641 RepID=A0A9D3NB02_9TELE|nr:hypothetical protein KOW79_019063 [Hemibagrus wyckioides]
MACANFAMDLIDDHSARRGAQGDEGPLIKHYRVSELIPAPELPLHQLLKREPAIWAGMQISSGVLSIGLGIMFAASFRIEDLLLTLFRVPIISGILFLVAGFFSIMLYRNPGLLQMCFHSNVLCLALASIGFVLLCLDLSKPVHLQHHPISYQVEILVLCVTLLDMIISTVLIFLINAEKRRHRKK